MKKYSENDLIRALSSISIQPDINEQKRRLNLILDKETKRSFILNFIDKFNMSNFKGISIVGSSVALASLIVIFTVPVLANSSVPGDVLYPVDRAYESVSSKFAAMGGSTSIAKNNLKLADERLEELIKVSKKDVNSDDVLKLLNEYEEDLASAKLKLGEVADKGISQDKLDQLNQVIKERLAELNAKLDKITPTTANTEVEDDVTEAKTITKNFGTVQKTTQTETEEEETTNTEDSNEVENKQEDRDEQNQETTNNSSETENNQEQETEDGNETKETPEPTHTAEPTEKPEIETED